MRPLFIEPLDVWLFRDGKAFSAGSDHHARSLFPPLPSAIQGALRSHYLVQSNVSLADPAAITACVGTAGDYKDLRLRGPFLRRDNTLFFPLPADVVATTQDGKTFVPLIPQLIKADEVVGNATPMTHVLLPTLGIAPQKFEPGYVAQSEFDTYLKGQAFEQTPTRDLFMREQRPGNAVDSSKQVTREGMLFLVEFIRTQPGVGLHVELEAGLAGLKTAKPMRLGGEGHAGRYEERPLAKPLPKPQIGKQRFKLVLLTPTFFAAGWQPADWTTHFKDGKVKCVAAALQRYISVGGFDLTQPKDGHKPALRYVDAGSVYFFEIESGEPQLTNDWLCDPSPSPNSAALGQIGFGQVAVGSW